MAAVQALYLRLVALESQVAELVELATKVADPCCALSRPGCASRGGATYSGLALSCYRRRTWAN